MSVNKSYDTNDPIKNYCLAHSTALHPVQVKLNQETMKHTRVSVLFFNLLHDACERFPRFNVSQSFKSLTYILAVLNLKIEFSQNFPSK